MLKAIQYVELRGDNPLAAVITGTNQNVHLVANLALIDGVEAAAEQYALSIGQIHGALAYYYDNQEAIEQAHEDAWNNPNRKGTSIEELRALKAQKK
jgi:hypothetical protein